MIDVTSAAMSAAFIPLTVADVAERMNARLSVQSSRKTATIATAPARIDPQLTWRRESGWA